MARTQERDKTEAVGMHVYHTDKYRNVYYDVFTKKAYAIFNSEVSRFNLYNVKGIAALLTGFTFNYYLKVDAFLSILIGIALYVVISLIFRFKMLPQLTEIKGFKKPEGSSYIDNIVERSSVLKICILMLLVAVFIVLTVINIKTQEYTGSTLYLNYALTVAGVVLLVMYTMALIRKIRQ